jgi:hypothetical protein
MAEAAADREPELADLLVQSAWRHLGGRPVRRPDRELPDALRFILCPPPAAGTRPLQRHRQSDRRLDRHQLLEATPWSRRPRFLIHDRDAVYGGDVDRRLAGLAITGVRTPPRAPKANSIAERIVRTIRTECLDHLIVIDERHLHAVLTEFAAYYNRDRPHRSLGLQAPIPGGPITQGLVISRPVLGGLHHVYARAA